MIKLTLWAKALKRDVMTLWFALRHPQTPWPCKLLAAILTAYALSPIDLIPDFIPVLGHLDDLIIIPAGVWLLLRLVPQQVLIESRSQAESWIQRGQKKPRSWPGLIVIVALWCLAAWGLYEFAMRR